MRRDKFFSDIIVFLLLAHPSLALLAYTDKYDYQINEAITIKINSTSTTNISVSVTNSTNLVVDSFVIPGSAALITHYYHQTLPEGEYTMTLMQGSDSVQLGFRVLSGIVKPVPEMKMKPELP